MSEYERQRSPEEKLSARRARSLLLAGCVAFLGVCVLLNVTIGRNLWRPYMSAYTDSLEQIRAHADVIDIVFLGSSHFAWGIEPRVFDSAVATQGGKTTSHLLTIAGLSWPWTSQLVRDLGTIDFADLRYVIVEPRLQVTPVRGRERDLFGNAFSARSRFINNVSRIGEPLWMLAAMDLPAREKAMLSAEVLYGAAASASNIGVIRDLLLPPAASNNQYEINWENRGGVASDGVISDGSFAKAIDIDHGRRRISSREQYELNRLTADIAAMGATPQFLFPPSRVDTGLQQATRDYLQTVVAENQILDFSFGGKSDEIYVEQAFWRDPDHLNSAGSSHFSEQLAKFWLAGARDRESVN